MKLFDNSTSIPSWLVKNRKKHDIAALLLTFVIVPVYSILLVVLTCQSVGLRVVETSISKLAWEYGDLHIAYLWGLVNFALFVYLAVLALNACGFNIKAKKAIISIIGISAVTTFTGVSIPFRPGDSNYTPRLCHNLFATLGFVMFAAITIAICIMLLFRNKKQGVAACAFMAFIVITGVYSIPQVNASSSEAFVTAAAQLYIFLILEVLLALIYLTQPLFDKYDEFERAARSADNGGEREQTSAVSGGSDEISDETSSPQDEAYAEEGSAVAGDIAGKDLPE